MLSRLKIWVSGIGERVVQRGTAGLRDEVERLARRVDAAEQQIAQSNAEASRRLEQQIAQTNAEASRRLELQIAQSSADAIGKIQSAIRELLPINQGAVVKTHPDYIADLFAALSDDMLLRVAHDMATLAPLMPMPHWRFGDFLSSANLAVHVRHSLWWNIKARGLQQELIVPWHGGTRLALRPGNDLSQTLFAAGCFEPNEFALLDRLLRPGMVFLDGGANEGAYAVFASARVGPAGRVIAVEPSPREIGRLRRNLALNDAGNVEVVEAALAEELGSLTLTVAADEHSGQNTLGAFVYEGVKSVDTRAVTATTLDDLVAQHKLTALDIVKLDLEGAELRALRGAHLLLGELKPLLLIEASEVALNRQGGSSAALIDLLREENYVVLVFDEESGEPAPLRSAARPLSNNIVAVHRGRNWTLPTLG